MYTSMYTYEQRDELLDVMAYCLLGFVYVNPKISSPPEVIFSDKFLCMVLSWDEQKQLSPKQTYFNKLSLKRVHK